MSDFNMSPKGLFGKYCKIAYGYARFNDGKQQYHVYKIISNFRSNKYSDVPLVYQTENNPTVHDEIVDVVNVIHCGIDESKVIRVALKDIELTDEYKAHWIQIDDTKCRCSKCDVIASIAIYPFGDKNYCPNCGAYSGGKTICENETLGEEL